MLPVEEVMQELPLLPVFPLSNTRDDIHQELAIPLLVTKLEVDRVMIHAIMDMLHHLLVKDVILFLLLLLSIVGHCIFVLLLTEVLGQVITDDVRMDGVISGGHLGSEGRGGVTLARD